MRCLDTEELIALREAAIRPEESAALRRHILGCPRCREREVALGAVGRLLPGAFADRAAASATPCADPLVLLDLVAGRLDGQEAGAARAHAADCAGCAASLAEVIAGRDAAPEARDALEREARGRVRALVTPAPAAARGRRWYWPAAAAVAASLALLAILPLRGPAPARPDASPVATTAERGPARPAGPARAPFLLAPREAERLPRADLVLRWRSMKGARSYEAVLLDDRGRTRWKGHSSTPELAVPADLPLEPDARYFAAITARLEDGSSVRAPAVSFSVASSGW